MKSKLLYILLFIVFCSCNDDDDQPRTALEQLPPATQTGEQTFACLIDGEPFIPPIFGNNAPRAFYQFVDGAYTFVLRGGLGGSLSLQSVTVGGIDVNALQEMSYPLYDEASGNHFGEYNIGGGLTYRGTATPNNPGILNITKIDTENFIISGTFEFEAEEINTGEIIKITEGRFDLNYTN
jgi:hypothetical protein